MSKKVISATITPLFEDGSLDREGLKNIFERNIRHGINGVFLFGSMGEWGSFSDAFKEETVELSSQIIGKRMELLTGINATSLPLTLELMKNYQKYDFSAYVYMPPARTTSRDPLKSALTVLDSADRPVYLYHCPPNNNINFTLEQFETLMQHPNLKGIKNSSSNMWLRRELLLLKEDMKSNVLLLEGQEWAVDEALLAGMDGMVCGMGALAAKPMVEIARAIEQGDYKKAVELQYVLIRIYHGVYGKNIENVWNGQKYALMKLGLCESAYTIAQEMSLLTPEAMTRIEKCLAEYKDILD